MSYTSFKGKASSGLIDETNTETWFHHYNSNISIQNSSEIIRIKCIFICIQRFIPLCDIKPLI